jgi:hypothetical protein
MHRYLFAALCVYFAFKPGDALKSKTQIIVNAASL